MQWLLRMFAWLCVLCREMPNDKLSADVKRMLKAGLSKRVFVGDCAQSLTDERLQPIIMEALPEARESPGLLNAARKYLRIRQANLRQWFNVVRKKSTLDGVAITDEVARQMICKFAESLAAV